MSLDQEAWAEIARLWLEGNESLGRIATRFAITHQAITARARRERWPPRRGDRQKDHAGRRAAHPPGVRRTARGDSSVAEPSDGAGPTGNVAHRSGRSPPRGQRRRRDHAGERRSMVERLFDAMDTKLSAIEERIASGGDTTSADSERTTRALNTLVRSLEKLADYEGKISKSTGGNDGKRRQASDDPERRRQELARRIERLLKRG